MRWTKKDLDDYNARRQRAARPDTDRGQTQVPEPQPAFQDEPVGPVPGEAIYPGRVRIRITAFRRRPTDPDNLVPKYFIDCLRYAGWIKDDRHEDVELELRQEKAKTDQEEVTEIYIEPIY